MNRRQFVGALGAGLGGMLGHRQAPPRPAERFVERWSWAMGQPVHLVVFADSEQRGLDACQAALAEVRRVEARLSLFDDASDLCELNRHAGRGPLRADEDLRRVLELAEGFRRSTGAAFNVAVEPLMRVWGFHQPRRTEPTAAEIAEAREAVAGARVVMDGPLVRLSGAHTRLDFGGIGVGYGIDRALGVLRAFGLKRALLDVSGDVGTLGAPPGEEGWPVQIAHPDRASTTIAETRLRDAALATSANTPSALQYRRHVVGHVMDPVSGCPAHALRQATVLAYTAVAADALSTGMLVRGRCPPGVAQSWVVGNAGPVSSAEDSPDPRK